MDDHQPEPTGTDARLGELRQPEATVRVDSGRGVIDLTGAIDATGTADGTRSTDGVGVPAARPVFAADVDRFGALAEILPFGILSADREGQVAYANPAALQIFNLDEREIRGLGWRTRVVTEDWADVYRACRHVIDAGVREQVSFRLDTNLFVRWAHATFVPLGGSAPATGWIATISDITERQSVEGRLAHEATHDPLTGLPNRALLADRLGRSLAGLQRGVSSVSVVFVDLDGFKAVNDLRGHRAGDAVLVEVGRRLRQVTRDVDTVARLGGDEFVAVCEAFEPGETDLLVERIEMMFAEPMVIDGWPVTVSASIGVAVATTAGTTADEVVARADQAMYLAKRRRREAR